MIIIRPQGNCHEGGIIWPKNEWNALGCLGESDKALAGCGTRSLKNEMSRERGRVRLYQQREKHAQRLGGTRGHAR